MRCFGSLSSAEKRWDVLESVQNAKEAKRKSLAALELRRLALSSDVLCKLGYYARAYKTMLLYRLSLSPVLLARYDVLLGASPLNFGAGWRSLAVARTSCLPILCSELWRRSSELSLICWQIASRAFLSGEDGERLAHREKLSSVLKHEAQQKPASSGKGRPSKAFSRG